MRLRNSGYCHSKTPYTELKTALAFLAGAALLPLSAPAATTDVRYVPNVIDQFNALTERPDAMGFYRGESPDPSSCKHYQGVVRIDADDGTPYFYVTRSGNVPTLCVGSDDPGNLLVVRMDSRHKFGERLRSNRIQRGVESMHTPPDPADTTVKYFTFDGKSQWPNYGHPGGMQAVGNIVAMALETPYDSGLPETAILFFDVTEREAPKKTSTFPLASGVKAGLVGLTPLPDGRYLLLVTGGTNDEIWFYESKPTPSRADGSTDLADPGLSWEFIDVWSEEHDGDYLGDDIDWPNGTRAAHQTLNFLREGGLNGQLYLAGARRGSLGIGEDKVDLYRVDRVNGEIKLKLISSVHKNAHPALDPSLSSPGNNTASFAAASTFYVSPSGELMLYATEHDNGGANESVKMGEWRHIQMVRPGSPTYLPSARILGVRVVDEGSDLPLSAEGVPAITKAWLQLWADPDFTDRYLVMDYDDRHKDDFDDFKNLEGSNYDFHHGFDDEPSSMLAYAPAGCTIRVNDDDFGDSDFPGQNTRTLPGTGAVFSATHLKDVRNDSDSGDIDNELTSAQFFADCDALYAQPVALRWDLENDGAYDASGNAATLSGAVTDGPETRVVRVQASHANNAGETLAQITVLNVAPTIGAVSMSDVLGQRIGADVPFVLVGQPLRVDAAFSDPGLRDRQSAIIAWGDGASSHEGEFDAFHDALGSGAGSLVETHTYGAAGDYAIALRVEDDDHGFDETSAAIKVATPEMAIVSVVDAIDALLAGHPPKRLANILEKIRRDLVGANGGAASDGALDKLDEASLQAALVKLQSASDGLAAAEQAGAGDLTALKNLLTLIIRQITNT